MTLENDTNIVRDAGFGEVASEVAAINRYVVSVIGINAYQHWKKLSNAVNDAQGIRDLFVETFGFAEPVSHLFDEAATKSAIVSLVEDQLRAELKPDDALILFFAGHGHSRVDQVGDREIETGFIIPVEAELNQWGTYLNLHDWLRAISTLPARHILVILDACHSGFGVGQAMQMFRDQVRYEQDLQRRISRKIFTSARRDQLALDGGPIEGHSLFTGTLIDGLAWGKSDTDSNGLVTGSELGLYVQQQVGQHSASKQTPDFGAFELDGRGDLVVKIGSNTFEGIRAQAYAALQRAEIARFAELTQKLTDLRPDSPEALYLQFRLALHNRMIDEAADFVSKLHKTSFTPGTVPLSDEETWWLIGQLRFWQALLSLPDGDFPVQINVLTGPNRGRVRHREPKPFGDLSGYLCQQNETLQFEIINNTGQTWFIYLMAVEEDGRLNFLPLWREPRLMLEGLPPFETEKSEFIKIYGDPGIKTYHFFAFPNMMPLLLSPPAPQSRAFADGNDISEEDLKRLHKTTRYFLKEIT